MTIELVQYMRPDGRQKEIWVDDMPNDLAPLVRAIRESGCRLAAEVLTTDHVSFTIECPEVEDDFDIEICSNGPKTKETLEAMIRRFSVEKLNAWKSEVANQ